MLKTPGISFDSLDEELLSNGDLISRSSLEGTFTLCVPLKDSSRSDDEEVSFISLLVFRTTLSSMLEQVTFGFERSGEFRWRVRLSLLFEVEAVCSDPRFKSIPLWFALDNASTAALVIESICFECIIL